MSYYGVTYPEYWTGPTGREIRRLGGKDAQLLGLYLTSCRAATMIGLYHLPIEDARHDTGLSRRAIVRAFGALEAASFATYDHATEHVWVFEMARFRLSLGRDDKLDGDDNRAKGARRFYAELRQNAFLGQFWDRYAKALHLGKRREPPARPQENEATPQPVGLARGHQGPCKPVTDQDQYQDQIRTEDQDTGPRARARPDRTTGGGAGVGSHPRDHLRHGCCPFLMAEGSTAPCVPDVLHGQLLQQLGGDSDRLQTFYLRIAGATKAPCGDDTFKFWRAHFAREIGELAPPPPTAADRRRAEEDRKIAGWAAERMAAKGAS